ncbi:hypothetical protein BDA96_04G377300 [Sorghum bicolor]|jgi:hypothetical protein|uniref:F-box domain-containing protein n=1 Tax=Sorghum bicolor TaxID=4558 RepID=A0A921ULH4_SORBI|nr:hypothetical protein BDA96_04G377300 [Sorghum bicolor]
MEDCSTTSMVGLGSLPLVEILSRVPAKSICRFKCVSKAWPDLIADRKKLLPQAIGLFIMTPNNFEEQEPMV